MKWIRESQKKTGWYWVKEDNEKQVVFCNGCVGDDGKWNWYQRANFTKKCLWSGPIKEPDGMRGNGKRVGRPRVKATWKDILDLRVAGKSFSEIAKILKIGKATAHRILKEG